MQSTLARYRIRLTATKHRAVINHFQGVKTYNFPAASINWKKRMLRLLIVFRLTR